MKLFIPAVGYRIKLTKEWSFDLYYESRNDSLMKVVDPGWDETPIGWQARYVGDRYSGGLKHVRTSLPLNTLLEVDRVYIRTMNKTAQSSDDDYDSVTFKVIDEKKKRTRFWAKLCDVNEIEYELPVEHTAGKDIAREKAKKPKKLTRLLIHDQIFGAFSTYQKQKPPWFNKANKLVFEVLAAEFKRRQRPIDEKNREIERIQDEAREKHRFDSGEISIPITFASIIKTWEDYKLHVGSKYTRSYGVNELQYEPRYFIAEVMFDRFNGYSTLKTTRNAAGRVVRSFKHKPQSELYRSDRADLSDFWIDVISNDDDTEIAEICGGFNDK
jgi:hypothetical protein